ncbi:MAG: sugar ABC transporter permease, partial [Ruminiclostridium sp.]|nr:sugar ABC transporter permease [Ruminiclostridium sp.]
MSKKFTRKMFFIGLPAIAGFLSMYVYPMLRVVYYSLINNTYHAKFVGLANYTEVLGNRYFRLAMRNTVIFSAVSVFLLLLIAVVLSYYILMNGNRMNRLLACAILPAAVPSAAMIYVWRACFANFYYDELCRHNFWGNAFEILPVLTLFLWKNAGISAIIVTA